MSSQIEKKPGTKTRRRTTKRAVAGQGRSIVEAYAGEVARVPLKGLSELREGGEGRVSGRRLVNYLRGNQAPPADGKDAPRSPTDSVYGLFWPASAAWVEEILERLIEEGYIELATPPARGLTITEAGERLLHGRERPGLGLLPCRAILGTHPKLEKRLWDLRRRLANAEKRPPYGVFSNATLAYLACHRPENLGELAAVPGLGEQRVRRYGRKILAILEKANS